MVGEWRDLNPGCLMLETPGNASWAHGSWQYTSIISGLWTTVCALSCYVHLMSSLTMIWNDFKGSNDCVPILASEAKSHQ